MSKKMKNRWLIAASAVGIHISIGSVYAYSVMKGPINQELGWKETSISAAFSVAILFLGLSAAFLGFLVDKKGPKFSGRLAAICYGLGTAGTGLSIMIGSYPLFIASYGVLGGIGLGIGYITPVSTLVKWFPDRRGLATGMAIMGFGFASLIFGPLMAKMFSATSIPYTFFILSVVYFLLMFSSASYMAPPPEGWVPDNMNTKEGTKATTHDLSQSTAKEALKTRRFYYMWIMLFINITCGIAIISDASLFAQSTTGMSAIAAATMVGLMGLFNGAGRIGWASLSDVIGRPLTYSSFFILQIIAFVLLTQITNPMLFQILIFLILTCYGGGFATVPAFLGDLFGTKQLSTIHGYTLTAWALAGLVGPTILSVIKEQTQDYSITLLIFSVFFGIALLVSILMILHIKKLRASTYE
ncbi:MAG: OFA family MFS transporter [Crocinitomicaceae bacterium]|nr:OFA family MFS transporter [Crocinitomicaceae bacterium]